MSKVSTSESAITLECDGYRAAHQSEARRRVACMPKVRLTQERADSSSRHSDTILTGEQVPSEKAEGNDTSTNRVLSYSSDGEFHSVTSDIRNAPTARVPPCHVSTIIRESRST